MTSAPLGARPRFRYLDGLRLVAALSVACYHFLAFRDAHWGEPTKVVFPFASKVAAYGALGVPMFFVISGFVIMMSARGRTVPEFATSRVSRLFPAYWTSVLASVVLFVVIAPGQFKHLSPQGVIANLTMLQTALGVGHVDGVYWTLWVELLFYVLVGSLISRLQDQRAIMGFAILWPLLALVADVSDFAFLRILGQPLYASLFAAGIALYLIHAHGHSLTRWLLFGFNGAVGTSQITQHFVLGTMSRYTQYHLSPTISVVVMLGILALVALVTVTPLAGRGPGWLTYAGALTYPLYLFHESWGWWVIGWGHTVMGRWATVGCAFLVAMVLAIVVERWIERPLRGVIQRGMKRSFDAPARHAAAAVETRTDPAVERPRELEPSVGS